MRKEKTPCRRIRGKERYWEEIVAIWVNASCIHSETASEGEYPAGESLAGQVRMSHELGERLLTRPRFLPKARERQSEYGAPEEYPFLSFLRGIPFPC